MKIVVTGGAGFIGGNFVHYMLNKYNDYKIIVVDSLTYAGNMETLDSVKDNKNFSFYKIDIADRDAVYDMFEKELPEASFDQCEKWVAHWSTKCTYQGSYQMWQATNRGTVNGINGAVDINFLMLPVAKITVKAAKKKVKVFWNQKGNGIKVQVFCSTKKNKGYKKIATVNSMKGKAVIKKKLKSKKKYYFKIRTLKSVNGRIYYSDYSKPKKIKG